MRVRDTEDFLENFLRDARATSRSAEAKLEELALYLAGMAERMDRRRAAIAEASARELVDEISAAQQVLRALADDHCTTHETLDRTRGLLERERAKYLDLFESGREASVLTSLRAVVREANAASGALLNMPARFLIGKPLIHFVARQDTRLFRDKIRELEARPSNDNFELRLRPRHGSVLKANVTATPVRGPGGTHMALRWILNAKGEREDESPTAEVKIVGAVAR
jgi:PAS domain S-box-containing protein